MEGSHAIKFYLIASCFKNDEKQLRRRENSYTSGHVKTMSFDLDVEPGHLQGEVQASMKKRSYKVEVYFHLTNGVVSTSCTCPRGQVLCHHIAALLYYAHYNISSTDKARAWGPTQSKDADTSQMATSIEELYPPEDFNSLGDSVIDDHKFDEFKMSLGSTNIVGFSWLLKPEVTEAISVLVPSIDDILFSEEYLKAEDKNGYFLENSSLSQERIKEIATATIGQHKNEGWLVTRKMRLTASKFEKVISACRRNKYPPSLFKSLMEGYDLHRVLAIQWGKNNEETALQKFMEVTELEVIPTGLWLHECGFLGASPDGLVGEDAIVEVKCPYKFRNCSIKDGVQDKKYFFHYEDDQAIVKCDHMYYHQIQGQLYLTGRDTCYFFVWTPTEYEILTIQKNPDWGVNIEILQKFYLEKLVPAIFDAKF